MAPVALRRFTVRQRPGVNSGLRYCRSRVLIDLPNYNCEQQKSVIRRVQGREVGTGGTWLDKCSAAAEWTKLVRRQKTTNTNLGLGRVNVSGEPLCYTCFDLKVHPYSFGTNALESLPFLYEKGR